MRYLTGTGGAKRIFVSIRTFISAASTGQTAQVMPPASTRFGCTLNGDCYGVLVLTAIYDAMIYIYIALYTA